MYHKVINRTKGGHVSLWNKGTWGKRGLEGRGDDAINEVMRVDFIINKASIERFVVY